MCESPLRCCVPDERAFRVTLRSYVRVLRERWRLATLVLLLGIGLASLITAASPKVYEADAQVFVSTNGSQPNSGQYDQQAAAQSMTTTFAQLVAIPEVVDAVRHRLNLPITEQQLADKLSATAPPQQTIVIIHAQDGNPDNAAAIANATATQFSTVVENLKTPTDSSTSSVRLFVTKQAISPSTPVSPNPLLNIALGAILGLLAGIALAVARDVLDTRIKDAQQLAKVAGQPLMGVVVEDPTTSRHPIATRAGTHNVRSENYRQLRANLQFANVDKHPRVIAVTSSIPSEGKTTVAVNLASTLAEAGFSVCLVDADLRRPAIAKLFGLLGPVGLTSILIHQIELTEAMQQAGTGFYVLTSGPTPPNPSEVLASSYVREVIHSLLDKVDYVVLDTAPLLPVADGSEVAAIADGTLLVARHGVTTDANVKRGVQTLSGVDAKLVGVVLNRVPISKRGEYGYSYGYYRKEDEPSHSRPEQRSRRGATSRWGKKQQDKLAKRPLPGGVRP